MKGTILDRTNRSGDSLESGGRAPQRGAIPVPRANGYIFMDNESFEQHTLPTESVADKVKFLKEGDVCGMLYWNGQLLDMTPPQQVVLEVTYTEPAARRTPPPTSPSLPPWKPKPSPSPRVYFPRREIEIAAATAAHRTGSRLRIARSVICRIH